MDGRPTWTDCDEAGDYVVPKVLSPRDLVFRPDNMDETVPHTLSYFPFICKCQFALYRKSKSSASGGWIDLARSGGQILKLLMVCIIKGEGLNCILCFIST